MQKSILSPREKIVWVFGSIFYIHSVVVSISTESNCHIWREDIVVPYVTTYAFMLRRDCYFIQINSHKHSHSLRGYFDEKRLDEIF